MTTMDDGMARMGDVEAIEAMLDRRPRVVKRAEVGRPDGSAAARRLVSVRVSDVAEAEVDWLWHPYLVKGGINLLAGIEGTGKSWLHMWLTSALTRGWPLPGEPYFEASDKVFTRKPAHVLVMTTEDPVRQVIKKRLRLLGADDRLVEVVTATKVGNARRSFSLQDDLDLLEAKLNEAPHALVVLDPLTVYINGSRRVDAFKEADVRAVLDPVSDLAERHAISVLGVMHFGKSGSERALHRVLNSVGFTAAARSVLLFGTDNDDAAIRNLVAAKHNWSEIVPPSLRFALRTDSFTFDGQSSMTAEQVTAPGTPSARTTATEWLNGMLAGGPVRVAKLKEEASGAGIAWRTIERAKEDLGAVAVKISLIEGWAWRLP